MTFWLHRQLNLCRRLVRARLRVVTLPPANTQIIYTGTVVLMHMLLFWPLKLPPSRFDVFGVRTRAVSGPVAQLTSSRPRAIPGFTAVALAVLNDLRHDLL